VAVRASATISFAAAKPGLVVPEAAPYTGRLCVREIGLPRLVQESLPPSFRLIKADLLRALPGPEAFQHKGRAGHVVVVGGSEGLCGAPHLAALGALRAGAGLVTAAAPGPLLDAIRGAVPDIMSHNLGACWGPDSGPALAPLLARAQALVVGPGLGRSNEAGQALASILALPDRPPAVIDADALFSLACDPARRSLLRQDDILTPHPGEAAVLLGGDSKAVQTDRLAALRELIALAPSIWVLKGAGTLIGRRGDPVSLCPVAAPNLAVGGSGDVLAGCMAALVAQGLSPDLAACAAVLLHAKAGLWLAERYPHRGNLASEIAAALAEMPRS
jgi:NAD(P)H-hydrate epimerase